MINSSVRRCRLLGLALSGSVCMIAPCSLAQSRDAVIRVHVADSARHPLAKVGVDADSIKRQSCDDSWRNQTGGCRRDHLSGLSRQSARQSRDERRPLRRPQTWRRLRVWPRILCPASQQLARSSRACAPISKRVANAEPADWGVRSHHCRTAGRCFDNRSDQHVNSDHDSDGNGTRQADIERLGAAPCQGGVPRHHDCHGCG